VDDKDLVLSKGLYTIKVSATGYQDASQEVRFLDGPQEFKVALTEALDVPGRTERKNFPFGSYALFGYDAYSRLIRIVYYDAAKNHTMEDAVETGAFLMFDRNPNFISVSEIDEKGRLVRENQYTPHGEFTGREEYEYGADGIVRWVYYSSPDTLLVEYVAKPGNHLTASGTSKSISVHEWDGEGNLVCATYYNQDGSVMHVETP
jgi:hypothetical protein